MKNFNIIPVTQTEINVPNENKKHKYEKISIFLKKSDFENCCDNFFKKIISLIKNILIKSKISIMDLDDIILIGQISRSSKLRTLIYDIFKNNNKINKILLLSDSDLIIKEMGDNYLIPIGCGLQAMNNNNMMISNYNFTDVSPFSFGIENIDGLMNIFIQKGKKLPFKNKKLVKTKIINENIYINIFEGEERFAKNNKFITCVTLERSNFKEN